MLVINPPVMNNTYTSLRFINPLQKSIL